MTTTVTDMRVKKVAQRSRIWIGALLVLVSALIGTNVAYASDTGAFQPAATTIDDFNDNGGDDRPTFYGLVEQMPDGGRLGNWQIGGQTVVANEQTEYDETEGAIAVGVCVKVTFVAQESTVAHEIDSEPANDCSGNGGDDNEGPDFYGLVEQMPDGGRLGNWQIGGQTVVANEQTEYDETEGPIAVGVCVKVTFVAQGSTVAREIDSEPANDCNGNDDDDDDGAEVYGIVEAMPDGSLIGIWTVSSNQYTVTAQSELKTEYGAFDIGRCVKIHLVTGTTDTVREMETERSYKCQNGGDDDDDDTPPEGVIGGGEIYGELVSFPEGRIGLWAVGTLTFTATSATEFKTNNGEFTVGEIVKVEFYILQDGTFLAREIKTAIANWNDDDDDDDDGGNGRNEGHAFGLIEQLPDNGLIGLWIVSGVQYSVTERTELHNRGETFAVGAMVKIEFKKDDSGARIAREIKLKQPQGTPGDDEAKLVGFVDAMPPSGFTGLWIVNGVEFTATEQSKFEEDDGALTVGAFVKVEYRTVDGQRIIHEMETEVPPGGGDDNHVGSVEAMDDSLTAASAVVNSTWVIGGRSFVVTPSTRVDGSLATSDTAWVNSYTATDGTQVATRIEGLALNNVLYLPVTQR